MTKDTYWREYLEAHKDILKSNKDAMEKIGNGIEALSQSHADHRRKSVEYAEVLVGQHNNISSKLGDYYKLIIMLILMVGALVGVKLMNGEVAALV